MKDEGGRMKILILAENDWSGAGYALMQALNANGHEARAVVMDDHWYTAYATDVVRPDNETYRNLLDWADVWNIHDDAYRHIPTDIRLKPVVATYHGSWYRQNHEAINAEAKRRGWQQTCLTRDLAQYGPAWIGRAQTRIVTRMHGLKASLRVAHAPTNRDAKGTAIVLEALRDLPGVELDLIEGVSNAECLERKAQADVFIDQVGPRALGYGTNALEAWSLGVPVISWDSSHDWRYTPWYPAQTAGDVRAAVEALRDPTARQEWAERGRKWIAEHHAPEVVAKRFTDLCQKAIDNPLVSVCMIVRNEEELLEQAIRSTDGLADEIVIVDTGSEDGTVALAERLGARVITGGDRMHKGGSRNQAMEAARGQWIVILDADETIADPVGLRAHLETTKARAFYVQIKAGDFQWAQMRIWRKGAFQYKYRAHEVPVATTNWRGVETCAFVWDHHQPGKRWGWKLNYTLERLRLDVEENPLDGRPVYYLGRQHVYMEHWQDGIEWLRRYLEMAPDGIDVEEAHKHLAHCYDKLGDKRQKLAELHLAIAANPDHRDTWCQLGEEYYNAEQFVAAAAMFVGALEIPRNGDSYNVDGWYGADAYDFAARSLWHLGRLEDGLAYARKACEIEPGNARLANNLRWCERKLGG
jgi:glycosyltransferase involved in cell wall biosynthesis